jgi:hypothetical protein
MGDVFIAEGYTGKQKYNVFTMMKSGDVVPLGRVEKVWHVRKKSRKRGKSTGPRIGTFVALIPSESGELVVRIGWSKCCLRKGGEPIDSFYEKEGIRVATARAAKDRSIPMAQSMVGLAGTFERRCRSYFKGKLVRFARGAMEEWEECEV